MRYLLEFGGYIWVMVTPEELPQEAEIVPWSTVPWHLQPASQAVIKNSTDYLKMHCCVVFEEIKLPGHSKSWCCPRFLCRFKSVFILSSILLPSSLYCYTYLCDLFWEERIALYFTNFLVLHRSKRQFQPFTRIFLHCVFSALLAFIQSYLV